MSRGVPCPSCGEPVEPDAVDFGRGIRCPACGATVRTHDADGRGQLPSGSGRAAVPPPRAARTEDDATLALALGAIGLLVPFVAPVAWWLGARSARRLRGAGSEVPGTTRTAIGLGIFGTCVLVVALVCVGPALLFG